MERKTASCLTRISHSVDGLQLERRRAARLGSVLEAAGVFWAADQGPCRPIAGVFGAAAQTFPAVVTHSDGESPGVRFSHHAGAAVAGSGDQARTF